MTLPPKIGLYDPQFEHDACGIGLVANIKGTASHEIVQKGVGILLNLVHRGAAGSDPLTGDGAGILTQMPDEFLRRECEKIHIRLPSQGNYGAGLVFLPKDPVQAERCQQILEDKIFGTGQRLLGWREVPVDESSLGPLSRSSAPRVMQVLVGSTCAEPGAFERKLMTPSPFDDFLKGDDAALTDAEKHGLNLFITTGCTVCHNGMGIGGHLYQKLGLVKEWPTEDLGRYEVTGVETDKYFFKVPSLRNITETAPYLHDGSVETLPEIVSKMAEYQLGRILSDEDVDAIVTFLGALKGRVDEDYIREPELPADGPDTPKGKS